MKSWPENSVHENYAFCGSSTVALYHAQCGQSIEPGTLEDWFPGKHCTKEESKSNISDHLVAELSRKTVWLRNLLVGDTNVLCSVTNTPPDHVNHLKFYRWYRRGPCRVAEWCDRVHWFLVPSLRRLKSAPKIWHRPRWSCCVRATLVQIEKRHRCVSTCLTRDLILER